MSPTKGVVVSIPKSRRARMPEAAHPTPLEQYLDKVIIISHFALIGFAFFLFELWYVTSSHNKRASFHLIIIFPPHHIFVRFWERKKLIFVETTLISYLVGHQQKVGIWPCTGTKDFRTRFYKGTDREKAGTMVQDRPTDPTFCCCPSYWHFRCHLLK